MSKLHFENFGQTTNKFDDKKIGAVAELKIQHEENSNLVKRSLQNSKSNFKISQFLEYEKTNKHAQLQADLKKSLLNKRESVEELNFFQKLFQSTGYTGEIPNSPNSAMRSRNSNSPKSPIYTLSTWNVSRLNKYLFNFNNFNNLNNQLSPLERDSRSPSQSPRQFQFLSELKSQFNQFLRSKNGTFSPHHLKDYPQFERMFTFKYLPTFLTQIGKKNINASISPKNSLNEKQKEFNDKKRATINTQSINQNYNLLDSIPNEEIEQSYLKILPIKTTHNWRKILHSNSNHQKYINNDNNFSLATANNLRKIKDKKDYNINNGNIYIRNHYITNNNYNNNNNFSSSKKANFPGISHLKFITSVAQQKNTLSQNKVSNFKLKNTDQATKSYPINLKKSLSVKTNKLVHRVSVAIRNRKNNYILSLIRKFNSSSRSNLYDEHQKKEVKASLFSTKKPNTSNIKINNESSQNQLKMKNIGKKLANNSRNQPQKYKLFYNSYLTNINRINENKLSNLGKTIESMEKEIANSGKELSDNNLHKIFKMVSNNKKFNCNKYITKIKNIFRRIDFNLIDRKKCTNIHLKRQLWNKYTFQNGKITSDDSFDEISYN